MGKLLFVLCAVGFLGYHFGIFGVDLGKASQWGAENRLHARATGMYESAEQRVNQTPDFEEATRLHHDNNVVLAHNNELVHNWPKNCPDQKPHDDGGRFTMDLTGCKGGEEITLRFGETLNPVLWQAKLYRYGKGEPETESEKEIGKKLIELSEEADIVVMRNDGSSVEPVADHSSIWKGFVMLKYHGNADFVEFIRK